MKAYLDMLRHVYEQGIDRHNATDKQDPAYQTGVTDGGTRGLFGYQLRHDLSSGFPLLTTKKVYRKAIVHELLWLISGSTNIQYLCQNKVRIWDDWPFARYQKSDVYVGETIREFAAKLAADDAFAAVWGDLGSVYGQSWRRWPNGDGTSVDQLGAAIDRIKQNPHSRRILVVAWNPSYAHSGDAIVAPPPCHTLFQFHVAQGKLSCQLYQRSADVFLGVPFNIASYALLTHMVAQVCGLQVGDFVHSFGDVHVYDDHFAQVEEQLSRAPRALPRLVLDPSIMSIDDFRYEHISLEGYDPHPAIKAKVSL